MGGKAAITLGLVAGLLVGGLLVGGTIALAPIPSAEPSPVPSVEPSPVPSVAPTDRPAASPAAASGGPASAEPSAAASSGGPSPAASSGSTGIPTIGQPAPPLQLTAVGGGTIDLASLRGKPVWVNLMATTCEPCRAELPLLQEFAAQYEDAGLVVLLVDAGEDEATVKAALDELNVYLPTALDADGAVRAAWGAETLPLHVWIDADGIVRETAPGGLGQDALAERLQTILPSGSVTP